MASTTTRPGGPATKTVSPDNQSSNGVIPHSTASAGVAVNRKKAKRRAKQAAKQAATHDQGGASDDLDSDVGESSSGQLHQSQPYANQTYNRNARYENHAYTDPDPPGGFVYSDEEDQYGYDARLHGANGGQNNITGTNQTVGKGKKKTRTSFSAHDHQPSESSDNVRSRTTYPHGRTTSAGTPRGISDDALRTVQRGINNGIWNTSSAEERQRIKEYWLSLGENERKALVKIEKNDVLKKMKDQQKHSCSCTVCGRKRVAIEEELEVLYDAYYQELEQYANHNQQFSDDGSAMLPPSQRFSQPPAQHPPNGVHQPVTARKPNRGRIQELPEHEDEEDVDDDDLDDDDEYSDDEYDEEEEEDGEYSGEEQDAISQQEPNEFFTFGKSLTVKGGILTVADDLLKNDGQKFIDMMEQLAQRRLQREDQAFYPPPSHQNYNTMPSQHTHSNHGHLPPEDDEYDEEDDEEYDSQDEEYDDEDEVDTMTETQRMDEGRRMFQIFAARMFEQRVLSAYRVKRAEERTLALLEDLEAEESAKAQAGAKNAAKKAKQRQKEKAKKEALKEEKARKAEEKATAEAAAEQKKLDEKRKKDEENRKKEEERKRKLELARMAQEEEKQRKKTEEREREDARKAREQRVREKREREEALRKERETKEREKKTRQEREEKERLEQAKAEREAHEKKRKTDQQMAQATKPVQPTEALLADPAKRPLLPAIVALPPSLKTKQSYTSHDSPQAKIVTPAIPKPPTPVRPKEVSRTVSQTSTPLTPEAAPRSKQSTPPKPASQQIVPPAPITMPRMRTPSQPNPMSHTPQLSPMHSIPPPPGMHAQHQGVPHMAMPHLSPNGFPGGSGPMMPGMMQHRMPLGHQMPIYQSHIPQMGAHHRPFMHAPVGGAPPGITPPQLPQHGRIYMPDPAQALHQNPSTSLPGPSQPPYPSSRDNAPPPHSRQTSMSYDTSSPPEASTPAAATQPIARPAPIKRPASVKPHEGMSDASKTISEVDELSTRLGSSALLDYNAEPLPTPTIDNRRTSAPLGIGNPTSTNTGYIGSPFDHIQSPFSLGGHGITSDTWRSPASQYGPPSASGWGSTPSSSGWGSAGGYPTAMHHRGSNPRPVTIRQLACHACKTLTHQSGGLDGGFHDFKDIVRTANEAARSMHEPLINQHEIRNILDTEGDAQNGGGSFMVRDDITRARTLVKWIPDVSEQGIGSSRTGLGLGEIGSPIPGNSIPALGGLGMGPRGF